MSSATTLWLKTNSVSNYVPKKGQKSWQKTLKTQKRRGPPNEKPVKITSMVDLDDEEVET